MSIQTFKKKGIIKHGSRRSGKPPGGEWISQGPFGSGKTLIFSVSSPGTEGFSLQGGHRNIGYVGQNMKMSKNKTPYRGQFAMGNGGRRGTYDQTGNSFVSPKVKAEVLGNQYRYIKPSVLSTRGMLERKYKWIHNGQYPNYWVQPVYGNDNLSMNASQMMYIQKKAAANVGPTAIYLPGVEPPKALCNPSCKQSYTNYSNYNLVSANGKYTKIIQPITSAQQTLKIQRPCADPLGRQKPFPFATTSGRGNSSSSYAPPPVSQIVYDTPPEWYWKNKCE